MGRTAGYCYRRVKFRAGRWSDLPSTLAVPLLRDAQPAARVVY